MSYFLFLTIFCHFFSASFAQNYVSNIYFKGFNTAGAEFTSTLSNYATIGQNCDPTKNYSIVVHDWREKIDAIWTRPLIQQFLNARQGCVFFMDYTYYNQDSYAQLKNHFNGIWNVLKEQLLIFENLGFNPAKAHLFGFGFGAHVVFEAAYRYGNRKINRIDVCDPAGPLFASTESSVVHAKDSAKNVQCIHTSSDYGTNLRYCQKNVNMGKCGYAQEGATEYPFTNHGLCPIYYNLSFVNDFALVNKQQVQQAYNIRCNSVQIVPNVAQGVLMGFKMDMTVPNGEYYAFAKSEWAPIAQVLEGN